MAALPRAIEFVVQLVFVREAIEGRTRRVVGGRSNERHGATPAVIVESPAAMKDAFAVLPENLRAAHPSTRRSVNAAPPDKLRGPAFRVERDKARHARALSTQQKSYPNG